MPERLSAKRSERLHAAAERHVGAELVPGLVALVAHGEQVHVEALGNLAIDGPPVARDSIFRIASTSKPLTAAATLAVIAEQLVGLDEPVERLLPELAERRVLRRMDGGPPDPHAQPDPDTWIANLGTLPLLARRAAHVGSAGWHMESRAGVRGRRSRPGLDRR